MADDKDDFLDHIKAIEDAISAGIYYLEEDRKAVGVVPKEANMAVFKRGLDSLNEIKNEHITMRQRAGLG